ncbi:bifunctional UDP-N-acetylmuramoyl-tripeptide:D-alanyl-D-alanine ligase/alanine racemase [soil metagenome]
MIFFKDLESIVKGNIIKCEENSPVTDLLTDSRKLIINPGSLFFAYKGERHNGHHFINELFHKGIRQFVIDDIELVDLNLLSKVNIILVPHSLVALQLLAAYKRSSFKIPVIAITGSNGKTIVKEWLSQLLSIKFRIVKSPKSYNSQLGVPLSIWQINSQHEIGVFEAGISEVGEMERLEKITQPDIGIITNLGTAHEINFSSSKEKLQEKLKLFNNCKTIIYCGDHHQIHQELIQDPVKKNKLISWSFKDNAFIKVKDLQKEKNYTSLKIKYQDLEHIFNLPFIDDASIENCLHCISCLLSLNFNSTEIQKGLSTLSGVSMRLELKEGRNNSYVIDDSYNNDLAGLEIALDFLAQQKQKKKKTVILSDIKESSLDDQKLYKSIAALVKQKGVDEFIGIGEKLEQHKAYFPITSEFFKTTDDFIKSLLPEEYGNQVILVKGARIFGFEKIVKQLQHKHHGTVLEIDLNALTHNLNFYKSRINPQTKIMVMVKAFAYGSGSYEVANLLQFHRIDYLAVAYTDEGMALRENGITIPIMVMNPSPETFDKLLYHNLEPEIYSLRILNAFLEYLKSQNLTSKIHLKVDTGMHRLGFEAADLEKALPLIKESKFIEVASIFSHLAGADEDLHQEFSNYQFKEFLQLSSKTEEYLGIKPLKHILNSAGIVRYPQYQLDMVRLGIGLYGIEVNNLFQHELQPISSLKTTISQIKNLRKGKTIGYGRKGVAEKDLAIATIAIGYADGFSRQFSNGKGKVLINGRPAPVIGNVCMDMTMVDITGIDAEEGGEVIIFGKELPLYEQIKSLDNFPYELLTNISERVKRIFYTE